jgi:hypothetical protein
MTPVGLADNKSRWLNVQVWYQITRGIIRGFWKPVPARVGLVGQTSTRGNLGYFEKTKH